jgi:hypothetical protein
MDPIKSTAAATIKAIAPNRIVRFMVSFIVIASTG